MSSIWVLKYWLLCCIELKAPSPPVLPHLQIAFTLCDSFFTVCHHCSSSSGINRDSPTQVEWLNISQFISENVIWDVDYEIMKVKMKVNVMEGKRVIAMEEWERGIDSGRGITEIERRLSNSVIHIFTFASFPSGITQNPWRNLLIIEDTINLSLTRMHKRLNHFK